jgi:hypothetical protein
MAAALTAPPETSNRVQDSNTKRVHVLASLSRQADRYDQPVDTRNWALWAHEDRSAAGCWTSGYAADRPAI